LVIKTPDQIRLYIYKMDPFKKYSGPSKNHKRICKESYPGAFADGAKFLSFMFGGPFGEVCSTHVLKTGQHCPGKVIALIDNEFYCKDCMNLLEEKKKVSTNKLMFVSR
jgi:hypothetical protein